MEKNSFKTKDIVLLAMLTAILFAQEQILTFLPQFQFTILLMVLYSKCLGFLKASIIIFIHVILDNLVMGSFNIIYTPAMLIGWMMIPILSNTVFKKVNSPLGLGLCGILYAFLYSWSFIPATVIMTDTEFIPYLIADIPFEIMLALFSFLTIYWLYKPLSKVLISLDESYVFRKKATEEKNQQQKK